MSMRIVLAADHGGFELKRELVEGLRAVTEYMVDDIGSFSTDPTDYPDFAHAAIQGLVNARFDRAILVDGTGSGMAIVANRYGGVRAACCADTFTARYAREHHDSNVLTLGGRVLGFGLAWDIVKIWLATDFTAQDRHMRRLSKIERG